MKKLLTVVILSSIAVLGFFVYNISACEPTPPGCEDIEIRSMGYWKNHEEVYIPHLSVLLGNENITNQEQVDEVFDNADASEMRDMLKAQLLAMKFNILHFGVGDYIYQDKTINQIVSEADILLQNSSSTREELELIKNTLNYLNNLGQVLICPSVLGCTDPDALNYNPDATIDDGTCEYENVCSPDSSDWGDLDKVDIGNLLSESGHNLEGWSEANLSGNYGGCQQGVICDYRQLIESPCTEQERNAYVTLDTGNNVASKIVIRHLDGISLLDSFDLYVNNNLVGNFNDNTQIVSEVWRETEFDVSQYDFQGLIELEIRATDSIWSQCSIYGQVSIDWISVRGCGYSEPEVPGCTDPDALNYNLDATIDDGTCEYPEPDALIIKAYKVVCDEEGNLPNWTDSGAPALIDENTASNYVSQSQEACHLEAGWDFQWGYSSVPKLSGDYVGLAPTGINYNEWKNFDSSTGISEEPATVKIYDLKGTPTIWIRESLKEGYIPFTNPPKGVAEDNISAEIYCHNDILNYDNYDYIASPVLGQTYYCVAFNVLKESEVPGCTNPEALNYNSEATIDDGTCEYPEPDTFSISGMKFNDQNDNGANDSESGLMDWTIELYLSDQLFSSTTTDTYGNYSFLILDPGAYTVCELQQVGGWVQTYPIDNNGCHIVELIDANISEINFGNHYQGFPIPGCTNPEALNYNSTATIDDGTCIYEIPGCTDPTALNYNASATVSDGSCTYGGGSVRPLFSIIKTVEQDYVNPGGTADYTIIVECLGSGIARNTTLKDILPEGFSYVGDEDGEWELGDMMRGDKETMIYQVLISEDVESGTYKNTAQVQASNSDLYKDIAELEVRGTTVKGDDFFPKLEIDKLVNGNTHSAGSYVSFTIKIKNIGQAPAVNVDVKDELPNRFIAEDGTTKIDWKIPLLEVGQTWEISYSAYIESIAPDGRYENKVMASAENHPQEVQDIALVVLGSLPYTAGESFDSVADSLKEWLNINIVIVKPSFYNYLTIPKIGVEIPIVQGEDDSALERGAWLLPQTTTPDKMMNTALAAHRYKYKPPQKQTFYLLDKVSNGDKLFVYWQGKEYIYSVNSISVVDPINTDVLKDTDEPTLTLITCHPLFSDKLRLVVQGELTNII